ncbi:MAG TPA: aminotransferase class I/II-fold pyridoxal phosphate-dependent enzyme, partial [Blastocatellia bacterium]|nr:aminotransferase class I/II-fold pyridoxal phosphate-dependent enzyme [Blastocatellia bacterium]
QMERMQSTWENVVAHNLAESGVHPLRVEELIPDQKDRQELLRLELGYSQGNGTLELRRAIAGMYPGAEPDNVMVTNGSSESLLLTAWMLTEPGDEVIVLLPNYMLTWGLVRSFGADVKPFRLVEERAWAPDLDQLNQAISPRTKLIAVCNPNNPTGAVLSEDEMNQIIDAARRAGDGGAWLLADEVYRGAERVGDLTPTFWGRYDRVIVTNGLSKAYGLPGLRIGWLVSTPELAERAWSYHDYATIGPSKVGDFLARVALADDVRPKLLARTRGIIESNYALLSDWIASQGDMFSLVPPKAGAIAYLRYNFDMASLSFVEALRDKKSVLIVPGAHFDMEYYLRIGFGSNATLLREGLALISGFISEL